jgi:mRNA-degrading endonuclease RelE of RelBE toxin-antitoxin system
MYTVKETPYFQREAAKIWRNEEREAFIDWISENPLAGDVVKEVGGLRKVRWSRSGTGKSGGVRVIYFNQLDDGFIVLLTIYSKSVNDTLSDAFLRRLRALDEGQNEQ